MIFLIKIIPDLFYLYTFDLLNKKSPFVNMVFKLTCKKYYLKIDLKSLTITIIYGELNPTDITLAR